MSQVRSRPVADPRIPEEERLRTQWAKQGTAEMNDYRRHTDPIVVSDSEYDYYEEEEEEDGALFRLHPPANTQELEARLHYLWHGRDENVYEPTQPFPSDGGEASSSDDEPPQKSQKSQRFVSSSGDEPPQKSQHKSRRFLSSEDEGGEPLKLTIRFNNGFCKRSLE
jgi:hypothetical protein